ncbi:DNA polymerase (pol2) [Zalerion maritima]|uniref:DNA polymerase (Pol2) n=1 Tax=Zalerion maritima TaxID=339359 RepID=A0AAD5WW26_9PEZI|nr:DNA polymerase (pol2) [Zalerion maritima]
MIPEDITNAFGDIPITKKLDVVGGDPLVQVVEKKCSLEALHTIMDENWTIMTWQGNEQDSSGDWGRDRLGTSIKAVAITYDILNEYSADYVNIHNGFNFDLPHLACWGALNDEVEETFEGRRLGTVGVGIFWKLKYGSTIVDSLYNADTTRTRGRTGQHSASTSEG